MLKEFLQGKWLGHAVHPALVHLPMGLLPAALVFDILSRMRDSATASAAMAVTSFYCIAAGLIVSLLAAPAGLADWLQIKPDRPAYRMGLWHMGLNLVGLVLWAVNFGLRWDRLRGRAEVPTAGLVLSVLGTGLLIVGAYLGSRMVFDQGIGVARFSKEKWKRLAAAGGARLP
jgi:uncharacterized membrane protein